MLNYIRTAVFTAISLFLICAPLSAQMSDQAIIEYVKSHTEKGESEKEIAQSLLKRGVSVEQMRELRNRYITRKNADFKEASDILENGDAERRLTEESVSYSAPTRNMAVARDSSSVFGHDVFTGEALTFEPNDNAATPADYVLGPGDQLSIDIWGMNEASIQKTILPEGRIMVSQIGPIYLSGLTIEQATAKIRKAFSQSYAGVEGMNPSSDISVTLSHIRTIQVNIIGEVSTPGTYRLSPFSNVFTALYKAGGISDTGSLRRVKVIRAGKPAFESDVYKYLFTGMTGDDFRLQEGDVILVPPYESIVTVTGEVKRPMKYEMVEGETLEQLINYAGGYGSKALLSDVSVVRKSDKEYKVVTVKQSDIPSFRMMDGDMVSVEAIADKISNKIEIKGSVYHPGVYELGGEIATLRQLVDHASGVREEAFLDRVLIVSELPDLTYETRAVNLRRILSGEDEDVLLKKNDAVIVSASYDLKENQYFSVIGHVRNPGDFVFAANTTLKDAIFQAGGFLDGASTAKIDVARRIDNPAGVSATDVISETFTYSLDDGLGMSSIENCILQPYDVVSVRKNPEFKEQSFVNISGEVAFEGDYALATNNERISDIIKRAGGLTEHAYVRGARVVRRMTEDEAQVRRSAMDAMETGIEGRDTLNVSDSFSSQTYTVGIDLEKALNKPGSDYDLVLRKYDSIIIPEYVGTVRMHGCVMYPNTVSYVPGKPLSYYINQAGGFGYRARKSAVYVVYLNGNVGKVHSASDIQPGCEIIVPQKPERREIMPAEVMSIGSSTASLAAMIATIVNITRR